MKTVNETVSTKNSVDRLFFLEASDGGKILLVNADSSNRKVIVAGSRIAVGIVVDG
jgi:hypothetical protein